MATQTPAYRSAVTIDSTNKVLVVTDEDGANRSVTLTEGDYYVENSGEDDDLISHITNTLNDGATSAWTCGLASNMFRAKCNTTDSSAWTIDWDHGNATFDPSILGVESDEYADWVGVADNEYVVADLQHRHGWFAGEAVVSEPSNNNQEWDGEQHRAVSGRVWTYKRHANEMRTIVHNYEPEAKTYITSGSENMSWEDFLATANSGERCRYYPDYSDLGTYFDCVLDKSCYNFKPARMAPGVALYGWTIVLLAYV